MILFALGMLTGVLLVKWEQTRARRQRSGVVIVKSVHDPATSTLWPSERVDAQR